MLNRIADSSKIALLVPAEFHFLVLNKLNVREQELNPESLSFDGSVGGDEGQNGLGAQRRLTTSLLEGKVCFKSTTRRNAGMEETCRKREPAGFYSAAN